MEGLFKPAMMMPDASLMQLQLHVRGLNLYYAPTVYGLALLGNVFSIVVLTDTIMKKLSNTHYIMGILVVETIHILLQFHAWFEENGWATGMSTIGGWCQFNTFATHISRFLCVWYTVFLSVDCYVRHTLSPVGLSLCKVWIARAFIGGAAVVAIVVYLNISILYGTVTVGPRLICVQLQMFSDTHAKLSFGDIIVNALIPTVLLLIFIALIIRSKCCYGNTKSQSQQASLLQNNQTSHCLGQTGKNIPGANKSTPLPSAMANSTGFIITFLVVHILCSTPLDAYHLVQTIEDFVSPVSARPSLKGFLLEQMLLYIRFVKRALNVIVLCGAYPLFRTSCRRLPARIQTALQLCKQHKQSDTPIEIEVTV